VECDHCDILDYNIRSEACCQLPHNNCTFFEIFMFQQLPKRNVYVTMTADDRHRFRDTDFTAHMTFSK